MDNPQQSNQATPNLSPEAVKALMGSAVWARILGVIGILASISILATIFKNDGFDNLDSLAIFSLVVAVFIFLPSIFLFRFSGKAKAAALNGRTDQFDEAFNALKGFLLICCIVGLVLTLLFIFVGNAQWQKG